MYFTYLFMIGIIQLFMLIMNVKDINFIFITFVLQLEFLQIDVMYILFSVFVVQYTSYIP